MWGWKRPRCLERVLAPENFPTRTTAARTAGRSTFFASIKHLGLTFSVKRSCQAHNSPDVVLSRGWVWGGLRLRNDVV